MHQVPGSTLVFDLMGTSCMSDTWLRPSDGTEEAGDSDFQQCRLPEKNQKRGWKEGMGKKEKNKNDVVVQHAEEN